ncbi:MAG: lytic transglycosylase domain-containing protein [Nitrosomonas sp.]|nr:MAG: lytic transglycosylase domain-containing protein [Nitrosomonas sp.]
MAKAQPKRKYPPANQFSRKSTRHYRSTHWQRRLVLAGLEIISLALVFVCAIIALLGHFANWFSGTHLLNHLLPFAAGVSGFILAAALLLIGWWRLRTWLQNYADWLMPALLILLVGYTGWLLTQDPFLTAYGNFRTLIGGKAEASRVTIAHQVYAHYRRYDSTQLQKLIDRSISYQQAINDAARSFAIDAHLLHGLAATESSFLPRDSLDGGRGLFQITKVPEAAVAQARNRLNVNQVTLQDPRHNAFVAAATLKHYLAEMKGDLFLGLLAYNIGPANGGLRFIMQQYGATDFTTIQPYLQTLPRDYPIRVLTHALAFRLWQREGKLLAYEQGNNAIRIQRTGIPGLHFD